MLQSYFQDFSASIGLAGSAGPPDARPATHHVTFVNIDVIKRPVPRTFVCVGYVDGFEIFDIRSEKAKKIAATVNTEHVAIVKLLPSSSGYPRNAAVVFKSSPSVVRLVDLTSGETFHLMRLTGAVVRVMASLSALAVTVDGRVHIFNPDSFEETLSGPAMVAADLGDRWLAYNLNAQQANVTAGSPRSLMGQMWTRLSSIGQDAFDNVVLAVSSYPAASAQEPTMSVLQSPIKSAKDSRNGIIAVRDAVSLKVIACLEEPRAVELLQWSDCGTKLLTTSDNGHSVSVYGIAHSQGSDEVSFVLIHSLSRGITPAVINSLCLDSAGAVAAVCSSKGTVHLFSLGSDVVGRIKLNGESNGIEPQCCFDEAGGIFVVNKHDLSVSRFSVDPLTCDAVKLQTYSVVRPVGYEEAVTLDLASLPLSLPQPSPQHSVELKTCKDLPVPLWRSPLLQMRNLGGQVRFTLNLGVKVKYANVVEGLDQRIERALNRALVAATEVETTNKFFINQKETTREGFVQIMSV